MSWTRFLLLCFTVTCLDGADKPSPVNYRAKRPSVATASPASIAAKHTKFEPESGVAILLDTKLDGRLTASGETFNSEALAASHRSLPFGTSVRVVNLRTGTSVVVRVVDRGPYDPGRLIGLTYRAAAELGIEREQQGEVRIEPEQPQ